MHFPSEFIQCILPLCACLLSVIGVLNKGLCFSHAKLPGQTASRRPPEKHTVMIPISSTIPPSSYHWDRHERGL